MNNHKLKFLLSFVSVYSILTTIAQSAQITLKFDHLGPAISVAAGSPEAAAGFQIGENILATITIDDTTPDTDASNDGKFQDFGGSITLTGETSGASLLYSGGVDFELDSNDELEIDSADQTASSLSLQVIQGDIDIEVSGSFFTDHDDLSQVIKDLLSNPFPSIETGTATTQYWDGVSEQMGMEFGPTQGTILITKIGTNPVPEPSTYALFGFGVVSIALYQRRTKRYAVQN